MRSLRGQLVLSHILPFVFIFPLVGLVILYLVEAQVLISDLSDDLEERAALLAEVVEQRPEVFGDPQAAAQFVGEISLFIDGEVYLLGPDGQLLAASDGLEVTPVPGIVVNAVAAGDPAVTVEHSLSEQSGDAVTRVVDVNEQIVGIVGVHQTLEGVASSISTLRRLVLLTIVGGMLLGALFGLWLARRLEQPITEAADAVNDIAHGRPGDPIDPSGPTEIRELSESVNMLSEQLRLLEQTRQRSLANIVHELGRPLGAILAAIHVLRQPPGEDPAIRKELLDGVEQELTQMQPLLDDLSQLHDEVTGQRRLEVRPVSMSEWLTTTILPWRAAALEKQQQWSANIPANLPDLTVDPDRMAQVVGNLLSNAIKYSPAGAEIGISADATQDAVTITVSDTGPGIATEEQERVFEPFYRSRHPQRFSEGLGLGLSIARSLVEAHGGTLTLVSTTEEGSAFTITLPRQGQPLPT